MTAFYIEMCIRDRVRSLKRNGYTNIIGRTHCELNLEEQNSVRDFFENEKPEYVVLAAARCV